MMSASTWAARAASVFFRFFQGFDPLVKRFEVFVAFLGLGWGDERGPPYSVEGVLRKVVLVVRS